MLSEHKFLFLTFPVGPSVQRVLTRHTITLRNREGESLREEPRERLS